MSANTPSEEKDVSSTPSTNLPKPLGNALPFSKSELRDKLFRDAGINKADLSAATKKAFKTLNEAMEAEKPTYVTWEGRVTDRVVDPDHKTRSNAASELLTLVDAYPSKQEGLVPSKITVEVKFPEWFKPRQAIDVTSKVVE